MKFLKPFFYSLLVILCSGEFSPLSFIEDNSSNMHEQRMEILGTMPSEDLIGEANLIKSTKMRSEIGANGITKSTGKLGQIGRAEALKFILPLNLNMTDSSGFEAFSTSLDQADITDANDLEIALSYPELHFSTNLSPELVDIICEGDAKGAIKHGRAFLSSHEAGKVTLVSKAAVDEAKGQTASCIIAASFGSGNGRTQQLIGLGNDADGLFFKLIDSTFHIIYKTNHEEVTVSQSNWSIDPMDGTGLSDLIFDYTKNHIFKIQCDLDFSKIDFYIESPLTGKFVLVHQVDDSSGYPVRSLSDLSLQVMAQVVNGPSQLKISFVNLFIDGHSIFLTP